MMVEYDLKIVGGTLVDGSGSERRRADAQLADDSARLVHSNAARIVFLTGVKA